MPPGRVVATEGEVGIQADVLKPGLHWIGFPFEKVVRKVPLIEIGADELGIIEAIDGEPMPPGRIFAPDRAQNAHNNFQDPIAFIKQGGVKGIQLRTIAPGSWPIHPYLFRVSVAKTTVIPQGKVGVVTAADGGPLDPGRLLGKSITRPPQLSGRRTVHLIRRPEGTTSRYSDAWHVSHTDSVRPLKERQRGKAWIVHSAAL